MLPPAVLGNRGEHPVVYPVPPVGMHDPMLQRVLEIPGTGWYPGHVTCGWDAAKAVAEALAVPAFEPPVNAPYPVLGWERYTAHGWSEWLRGYQKDAVEFLMRRSMAILALPMRTGKSSVALAADDLLGSQRTLILGPGAAKPGWAREIASRLGESALILDGRGRTEAAFFCLSCHGTGVTAEGACPTCRDLGGQSRGLIDVSIRQTSRPLKPAELREVYRWRSWAPWAAVQGSGWTPPSALWRCSKHAHVISYSPTTWCGVCWENLRQHVRTARFVIGNFDILTGQPLSVAGGQVLGQRADLPGWTSVIGDEAWDVAILDETQWLRGRPTKTRIGKAKVDQVRRALARAQYVWGLTGTFLYGKVRDGWAPLDIITKGLFGASYYDFDRAYANGHVNAHRGWEANGRSLRAETELVPRLELLTFQRKRSELGVDMPKLIPTIVRLDGEEPAELSRFVSPVVDDVADGKAFAKVLPAKLDALEENVLTELAEGGSAFVLTYCVASAKAVLKRIERALAAKANRDVAQAADVKTWLTHGTDSMRDQKCQEFVAHTARGSGGVFVATIDATQGALALRGATSVHFVELHHSPAPLLQARARPDFPGIKGLNLFVYLVRRSIDEQRVRLLIPKLETMVRVSNGVDEAAEEMLGILREDPFSPDDAWGRIRASVTE